MKEPAHYVPKIFGFKLCHKNGSKFPKEPDKDGDKKPAVENEVAE